MKSQAHNPAFHHDDSKIDTLNLKEFLDNIDQFLVDDIVILDSAISRIALKITRTKPNLSSRGFLQGHWKESNKQLEYHPQHPLPKKTWHLVKSIKAGIKVIRVKLGTTE